MSTDLPPKQEETAELIYKLTHEFNYPPTLDEIAAAMGITKGTLQYHMTALKKKNTITWNTGSARSVRVIDPQVLEHCREKFPQISKASAFNGDFDVESLARGIGDNVDAFQSQRVAIPILGKIAAGKPLDVLDKAEEYLELESFFPDGCYALRVKGQSMIDALISDGDLVLIEPKDAARNGEIVVALINNEAATLKRFFAEDGRIRLQPENPLMEPIYIDPRREDLKIQGIVKGVIRKV